MPGRFDPQDPAVDLMAFADGDLDAARSADVLEYLSTHPDDAKSLARAMRFRRVVARAMESDAPPPTRALRGKISDIVDHAAAELAKHALPRWRAGIQVWLAFIAAALFLLALGIAFGRLLFGPASGAPKPIPAAMITALTQVHVNCSRTPSLHNHPFPERMSALEAALTHHLGGAQPHPDLQVMGYEYLGAGPCEISLDGIVHLLYRSMRPPVVDTVSLFVQKYDPKAPFEDGMAEWVQARDAIHPMLMWRSGDLVFYIVGNAQQPVVQAAEQMHVHVPL